MKRTFLDFTEKKKESLLKIILVLIGAFAIYGGITGISAYRATLKSNYETYERQADSSIDSVLRSLDMIRGTMIALSGNESIVKWRNDNDYFDTTVKEGYLRVESLSNEMQRALIYNNGWNLNLFDYVTIYEDDRLLTYTFTKQQSIRLINERSSAICKEVQNADEYFNMFAPTEEDKTIYTTLRVQSDFDNGKSLYIIGATSHETFENDIKSMTGYEGAIAYLIDRNGQIFASNTDGSLGEEVDSVLLNLNAGTQRQNLKLDGINYSITKKTVNSDFSFIYMLPTREIMHQTILSIRSLLILMFFMTIVMASVVAMIESGYETRLLNDETEIKFLQNQMNPHFLFNILLTIQIKAKMSGAEEVSRMITSLSSLLRAGIYGDKRAKIKISEELKYVEYYLSLQKERYADRLTYSIEVTDDELLDCEIPRLSIEPLVENAIVHGLEEIEGEGITKVLVSSDKENVYVRVTDNGKGFDPEKLKDEASVLNEDGSVKREKVGLKNTDKRLKLMYGNAYGLSIDSAPGKGTEITVKIPRARWELA